MPLQFILGPSGSGKSYHLYQKIIEESMRNPSQNYIVLVPEQFTMQTQKDFVSMHPQHGIMNIDVLSFGRLAYRVFEETGGGTLPVLDDEGKNLILRKIAGDYEDELTVLRGNMKKLGYISEVKSVISEFAQYDIGEEELTCFMETLGESKLYYKLQDIRLLYHGFTAYLEDKFITKEEQLDVLARLVKESEILKKSTIVLDGFTGFTPVQNRLLRELLVHCKKVMITVTMDERENPYVYAHPYQLFALGKQMVTSLVDICRGSSVEIEAPVWLKGEPAYRFRNNPPLAFLERNLFRHPAGKYEKEQDAIQIRVARNPKEEALAVAETIRMLVRKDNIRYRDIGVIVSEMETYGDHLQRAFELYDIPVFMDHKRSILLNSFVEYIRSLLNMVEKNFSYESVFRFFRTNVSGFTWDEIDALENYVIGLGIKGYKKWQEKWIRRLRGMEEEDLEKLNHLRVIFVEKVDAFVYILKQKKKTVKDITLALYQFMVRENLQVRLKEQEEKFQAAGQLALAKEYAQIYRIILELFDKFVELLGDEYVSLNEYCKLLDAGLEEARVGVIPPSLDQVVTGDMERTRLKDVKVLFFIGANDSYLPGALLRTGLLTERDREKFQQKKLTLSPGGKEKTYVQKFYLYMNLTKPTEKLYVSYSKVSSDGKSLRPAYLIQELKKMFPEILEVDEENRAFSEKELTEKQVFTYLIEGLQRNAGAYDPVWQQIYSWYKASPKWKEKVEALLEAGYYKRPEDGLSHEVAQRLYGEDFPKSISRMERFSACAFAHFLTYGLRLKERQEYEFEAVDLGNVCHEALERFSLKVEKEKVTWTNLKDDIRQKFIEESVEEVITDYGNSVLYSSARKEYSIVRMKELLTRTVWALTEQLRSGDFEPSAYELRFASGKIDRIDVCEDEDKVYVKVLDYKTGKKNFDIIALYHGLQLQLMVYMNAALEMEKNKHSGKKIIPAGVFYYRLQEPFIDKQPEDLSEKMILKELRPDGIMNLEDDVLEHLDRKKAGESFVIPLKYNKDGSLAKGSKAVSTEDFHTMMSYAQTKVEEVYKEILNGNTKIEPYRRGQETGCDYCSYRNVCGFDKKIPGYQYNDIVQMEKEEAIAKMKAEGGRQNVGEMDNGTAECY